MSNARRCRLKLVNVHAENIIDTLSEDVDIEMFIYYVAMFIAHSCVSKISQYYWRWRRDR